MGTQKNRLYETFWAPKQMLRLMDKKIFTILHSKFWVTVFLTFVCLNKLTVEKTTSANNYKLTPKL